MNKPIMIIRRSPIIFFKKVFWLFFIIASYLAYLQISLAPPHFDSDSLGYMILMGKSFFSKDYWHILYTMFRPLTIPMVYSFFGSITLAHIYYIIYFQTLVAFLAWLTFSYALASLVKTKPFDSIIFVILMLTMFGRGSAGFNYYLLSDSLALSLVLFWYATVIKFPSIFACIAQKPESKRIIMMSIMISVFAVLTIVVTCTRDTNAIIILFGIPLLFKTEIPLLRMNKLILIVVILCISIISQIHASTRQQFNMLEIITGVILQDPAKRDFFIERGMPVDEKILRDKELMQPWRFVDLRIDSFRTQQKKVAQALGGFKNQAKLVYTEYLLLHPGYIANNIYLYHDYMLNQSPIQSKDMAWEKLSLIDDMPFVWLVFLGVFAFAAHYSLPASMQREKYFLFCSAILMLTGFSNAVIAFHGDFGILWEMQRHAFIGSVLFRIGCAGMLLGAGIELLNRQIKGTYAGHVDGVFHNSGMGS